MASNASKVKRRAIALNRLASLSDLLAEHLSVETPDVQVTNRDPELAEIQRIENINDLLANVLKASGVELPKEAEPEAETEEPEEAKVDLDGMTKAELLEFADAHGVEVAKSKTKAEIIEAIKAE